MSIVGVGEKGVGMGETEVAYVRTDAGVIRKLGKRPERPGDGSGSRGGMSREAKLSAR